MTYFLETDYKPRLRQFLGLFWPIFDSNDGVNIRKLILTPSFESKSRLKRTQKLTEARFVVGLLDLRVLELDKQFLHSHHVAGPH
jgi:hypothetical protein